MGRKICWLGMIVLVATLLCLPAASPAAMWVGGELGVNFTVDSNFKVNGFQNDTSSFNNCVLGGMTLGYDFINSGFLAYNWPEWMKYFSFATDFTYNRLSVFSQSQGLGEFLSKGGKIDGYQAVWTFMFIGHYGFLPDAEVPSGRINPYLGVGPAIMFSGLNFGALQPVSPVFSRYLGNASSTNIALVVEPGIRWMLLKNVSLDTAMRYRYAQPSYTVNGVSIKTDHFSQLELLVRANYHF